MDQKAEPTNDPTMGDNDDESAPTSLDLTSFELHDLISVKLPPFLTKLDLTANRLKTLDPRIGHLSNLKKFSFRQNLLDDSGIDPLSHWDTISDLQELVLRDNQLKKIPDVSILKRLLVFDVSFNEILSLNGLSKVSPTLKELYVSKNEVPKIEEIEHFHDLQLLELDPNRLREMENLQNLTHLQELWLGQNRIRAINLCGLKCIKKLDEWVRNLRIRKRARLDLKAKKSEELNKLTIWRGARWNYVVVGPGRARLAEDTDYLARAQGQNRARWSLGIIADLLFLFSIRARLGFLVTKCIKVLKDAINTGF